MGVVGTSDISQCSDVVFRLVFIPLFHAAYDLNSHTVQCSANECLIGTNII